MNPFRFPPKRPDEILDYEIDFGAESPNENLTNTRVTATNLTVVSQSLNNKIVRFRLSGGTANTESVITVEVDTASGQLIETVVMLRII